MDGHTNPVAKRQASGGRTLTAADVVKAMNKVNRSRESARRFLKSVGVSFSKNGDVRVRPI